jgi:cell wall-associated NlpC family hydrolase
MISMKVNTYFLNFVKVAFVLLLASFIAYKFYDKSEVSRTENTAKNSEVSLASFKEEGSIKDSIVNFGMQLLGTPYQAAGCSLDGFDCSGFIYFVFQHFNIKVPRSSADFENFGVEIPIEKVEKGDILLFLSPTRNAIGHIGIVSKANGKESDFMHATSGREMKVVLTSLKNAGYTKRFVKAIRVLN